MDRPGNSPGIYVYVIQHHPLELPDGDSAFRWLHLDNGYRRSLEGLMGSPFRPEDYELLVDDQPAGPGWRRLLSSLLEERVTAVVTHLAPLSAAQRQQLIGVCAQTGAQLITPGDAGRNRLLEPPPHSL
ncbi:MAG: hypothetical protein FJZ97_09715 [Chloroflexi bacterium]|nr:hypothetical protein [Chloroflexota bacterium]